MMEKKGFYVAEDGRISGCVPVDVIAMENLVTELKYLRKRRDELVSACQAALDALALDAEYDSVDDSFIGLSPRGNIFAELTIRLRDVLNEDDK